jgi:hypothetical protein
MKYELVSSVVLLLLGVHPTHAQQTIPCRILSSHVDSEAMREDGGRPNRSYKIGTTIMLRAVELKRPNMITIAIGA